MPRGGRRPGAGAPKGNLNGLKTGKYSPRVRRAVRHILDDPDARRAFFQFLALAAQAEPRPSRAQAYLDKVRTARGTPPPLAAVDERHERLLRSMRRMRAVLTARIRATDRRANTWHALLAEEEAKLKPPLSTRWRGAGGEFTTQSIQSKPIHDPALIQSEINEETSFDVRSNADDSAH